MKTTEEWIWELEGDSFDKKVENAPTPLRKIHQSSRVLESLLQMTDIIANPDSAKFGYPVPTRIHAVIYMLAKIFEDKALARQIEIQVWGPSDNTPRLYKSFIVVPLVILDNAVKHSKSPSTIYVNVNDRPCGGVSVKISSEGRIIDEKDRQLIFKKAVRGTNVKARGSGLGLFIAQEVSRVNGFEITYDPEPFETRPSFGYNKFSFVIPGDTPPK